MPVYNDRETDGTMLEITRTTASPTHDAFLLENGLVRLNPADAPWPTGPDLLVSIQFFGQHCTECAAPDCHATCDLYRHGRDGFCARFVDGIVCCRTPESPIGIGYEVIARPWAMFMCVGNRWLLRPVKARWIVRGLLWVSRILRMVFIASRLLPARLQWRVADLSRGLWNRIPRAMNHHAARDAVVESVLLLLAGNPGSQPLEADLLLAGFGTSQGGRSFSRRVLLRPGWNRVEIPVAEISGYINLESLFRLALVPLNTDEVFLQIAWLGFVGRLLPGSAPAALSNAPHAKLVIFDLDETLWQGILLEAGADAITLKPGVRKLLETLDARGILLSISSRNTPGDAMQVLDRLGIAEFFLCPQIGWMPKSAAVSTIVKTLDIGFDTVLFIDDSPFERTEVQTALPMVEVIDSAMIADLAEHPRLQVPVTPEGARRRELYRAQLRRQDAMAGQSGDLSGFLETCRQELRVVELDDENRLRVHELVQRTNQLNFSGVHYSRDDLERLLAGPDTLPLVMRATDRFGDYGVSGFALLRRQPDGSLLVRDMMFSCRLQGKKFEAAFLHWLAGAAAARHLEVHCRYVPTIRNKHAGAVFTELGASLLTEGPENARVFHIPPVIHARYPVTVQCLGIAL
jgi:FkbH-like protein